MKRYEQATETVLMQGCPIIIRLDGKSFHRWTKLAGCRKPFDFNMMHAMHVGAMKAMEQIQGSRFAYIQSDECSIVVNDRLSLESSPAFGNRLQKLCSVAASAMTAGFNIGWHAGWHGVNPPVAMFDARVFQVPDITEMHNAILWRQFDASKNSITMYASRYFSHSQLQGKSGAEKQEMLFSEYGFNWNNAPAWTRRGIISTRHGYRDEIPLFNQEPEYLKNLYLPEEQQQRQDPCVGTCQ